MVKARWTYDEVPWGDDSKWTEFDFEPFGLDADTGQKPEGVEYLFHLPDGAKIRDARGQLFTKVADGPVQGACVVKRNRRYSQFAGDQLFRVVGRRKRERRERCTCAGEAMDRRPDVWCPIHGDETQQHPLQRRKPAQ